MFCLFVFAFFFLQFRPFFMCVLLRKLGFLFSLTACIIGVNAPEKKKKYYGVISGKKLYFRFGITIL